MEEIKGTFTPEQTVEGTLSTEQAIDGRMDVAEYSGGGGGGTTNYNLLSNKPKINGVELSGNKTTSELNISYNDLRNKPTIPSAYEDLTGRPQINGVDLAGNKTTIQLNISYNDLQNKPSIPSTYEELAGHPTVNGVELLGNKTTTDLNISYNDLQDKPVVPDISTVVDILYPVGTIYISINPANPGATMGGTWESFGAGKTLIGVDNTDTDFDAPEKTGGEKTHTLTIAEMPSHNHSILRPRWSTQAGANAVYGSNGTGTGANRDADAYEGGGEAHNNMQPYITTYMWKRIA